VSDDGDFLGRWSRRKIAARAGKSAPAEPSQPQPVVPSGTQAQATPAAVHAPAVGVAPESPNTALPPVESLTPESDFLPFMQPGVDPGLKRAALKTLLRDARFNVMDGLDVYIDDYSKPDPIPAEWLGQLKQLERLGHYIEPEEKPENDEKKVETAQEALPREPQEAMQEAPVSFPQKAPSPDTAGEDAPAPE
jgi:hypothetical protein